MASTVIGKIFYLGDDVNTDEIIPARYCMTTDMDSLGNHALEDLQQNKNLSNTAFKPNEFAIIAGGKNFGCGSSREFAPVALQKAGIQCIIAESFGAIFYRNAVNCGLPISTNYRLIQEIERNSQKIHSIDLEEDRFWEEMPGLYRKIIETGGLTPFNKLGISYNEPKISARPMTLAEKVIANACKKEYVQPDMIVLAEVDRVVTHEITLPVSAEMMYQKYGRDYKIQNPEKILFVADHSVQIPLIKNNTRSQKLIEKAKLFIEEQQLPNAFLPTQSNSSQGICHVLFPEKGFIQPDTLVVGTDSHSCTYGAFGCLAFGIGNVDLVEIMVSGKTLLKVPNSIKVKLNGGLAAGVSAKDLILYLLKKVSAKGFNDCVVEFEGDAIGKLTQEDRSTIANMTVEGGAICGLFPVGNLRADDHSNYIKSYEFDLSEISPQVAKPFSPDNVINVDSKEMSEVEIDVAWIGSCTGGKFEDIEMVVKVLQECPERIKSRLIVSPATMKIYQKADRLGYLDLIRQLGGEIVPPGCGACIGMGPGTLKKGQKGIFASNRNFKGRTGLGETYLASPATVAASALKGRITDPRQILKSY